nr:hypothetical protein 3 [bacterium]
MHRVKLFLGTVVLAISTSAASAATIKGAYAGCLTPDLLDEFITAASNKDLRQINALLGQGCFNIEGREYSVIDRGFMTSKIRVYVGGSSLKLYTVSEALR